MCIRDRYTTAPGQTHYHYEQTQPVDAQAQQAAYEQQQREYAAQQQAYAQQQQQYQQQPQKHEAQGQQEEFGDDAPGDEYGQLIAFIRAQKQKGGDDEDMNDGPRVVKKRNWLMPWKVREVRVNKNGEEETVAQKVPESWLETDIHLSLIHI